VELSDCGNAAFCPAGSFSQHSSRYAWLGRRGLSMAGAEGTAAVSADMAAPDTSVEAARAAAIELAGLVHSLRERTTTLPSVYSIAFTIGTLFATVGLSIPPAAM
jgi:hypothetical protein